MVILVFKNIFPHTPEHVHQLALVYALAARVLKRVKDKPQGTNQQVPANIKNAAPETQRVMVFKNREGR